MLYTGKEIKDTTVRAIGALAPRIARDFSLILMNVEPIKKGNEVIAVTATFTLRSLKSVQKASFTHTFHKDELGEDVARFIDRYLEFRKEQNLPINIHKILEMYSKADMVVRYVVDPSLVQAGNTKIYNDNYAYIQSYRLVMNITHSIFKFMRPVATKGNYVAAKEEFLSKNMVITDTKRPYTATIPLEQGGIINE